MPQKKNKTKIQPLRVPLHIIKLIGIGFCIVLFFVYLYTQRPQSAVGFLADNQHTGDYTADNPSQKNISWSKYQTYGYFISSPVIKNNIIYVGELYGNALTAVNLNTGKRLWSFTAEDDVPFVPAVTDTTAYITSTDGRLYALNTSNGEKRWEYRVKNFYAMATSPTYFHNTVFFGSRDTYLYAINATSGKERWKFKTGGGIDATPVIKGNTIYVGSFDGYFYAVDINTGKERWKFKTRGKIIGTAAEQNGVVYFGSADSYVYSLDGNNGRLLWKIATSGSVGTSPTIFRNILFIANTKNVLYAIDIPKHTVKWKKSIPTDGYTGVAVKDNALYIGSRNGFLYALRVDDGKEIWKFHTDASIAAAPSIVDNKVFVTNRNGALYAVNRTDGHPFTETNFQVSADSTRPTVNNPYELTIQYNSSEYQYPWLEASVSATLRHNSLTMKVAGFYYDKNTWKIRFTPPEAGEWLWDITLSAYSNSINTKSGKFTVVPSSSDGFIQLNTYNENRLELPGGKLFQPMGIQTCLNDANDDGFYLDSLYVDTKIVNLDTYLKTYGENGAGFNIFRWGVENCTFRLWYFNEDFRAPQRFLDREGIWADILMNKLKENGFHIWFTIFNTGPVASETNLAAMMNDIHFLDPYLDYVVARYGAYVDVWELLNESNAPDAWVAYVVNYIHAIDPYHHLISTSWQKPVRPEIDITSPHWYQTDPLSVTDLAISDIINQNKFGKPTVFGEVGNQGYNWSSNSFMQMRIRIWTSFFEEAGVIFWDTSNVKNYFNKENANIYLGPDERSAVRTFQNFTKNMPGNIHELTVTPTNAAVRAYAAETPTAYYGYAYHYASPDEQTATTLLLPYRDWVNPIVTWIDPSTGKILAKEELSNYGAVDSPAFSSDVAFSIVDEGVKQ